MTLASSFSVNKSITSILSTQVLKLLKPFNSRLERPLTILLFSQTVLLHMCLTVYYIHPIFYYHLSSVKKKKTKVAPILIQSEYSVE